MHTPRQQISYVSKDNSYEELEQVFDHFSNYHTKILLGNFKAKLGREDIFKPTSWNESLHQDSYDNSVRIANFATSKIVVVKSMKFRTRNIQKYTRISPDVKTHNQIGNIMTVWRWHSSIPMYFIREVDCDTDHYLVVAKFKEGLTINKQAAEKFDVERFKLRKLSEMEYRK